MEKSSTPYRRSSTQSFTLIELIIIIIIVGILAAVGISQYSKTVEKGRGAEARMILGQIRTLAYQYRLENGSITGLQDSDVNIGFSSNQIPRCCTSSFYFNYHVTSANDPVIKVGAWRCPGGGPCWEGKAPNQNPALCSTECEGAQLCLQSNLATGEDTRTGCY